MPVIELLSQSTIDKIAAGEVVERPLSVVKELTENAIDAGADAITVEIKEGGISLVRVTDNGCGIEKEQIKRAFLRHATSKITSIDDLHSVKSLGFRGEALSSIAAVAQVELLTKTKEELIGIRYSIAGGREEELQEVGVPNGTTFLVRNLFYNTPARKKFLKQPQTEGGYISDLMEHMALSHPDISIKFIQNGQIRFHTSGNGDLKEIIYRIYGRDIAGALIPFELENENFQVRGFLGKPELNRSNRNFETYFVNGRYIKNDIITKAVEEGYRTSMMQHKFPFFVLHFMIAPERIDVNVHPAKMEIRLSCGSEIYDALSKEIQDALRKREMIPDIKLTEERENRAAAPARTPEPFEIRRSAMMLQESTPEYESAAQHETPAAYEGGRIIGNEKKACQNRGDDFRSNIIKAGEHILVEKAAQLDLFEEKFLTKEARAEYRILGQIFDTYWLIAFSDKLFIIDQHAAHEKVKYERLMKELSEHAVTSQMLNPPVVIQLTSIEEGILQEYLSFFHDLGFEIEDFGGNAYAVRSMPADLYGCDEKELFTDILDELTDNAMRGAPEVIRQKLASMACKSAVKGNHKLDVREAEALLDELLALDDPYHCPHGRPTIISMSKYEIEKKFKRIV